ncbi:MAG TPA: hypothetical protein VN939_02435 [Chthoniobacterales bacterium]|jgi:hypothetical protein|nr:hypothetical protein [Chthoniobacterales bacterium]
MSELVRWKEYRVRQEIYKQHLKEIEKSAARADSNEANPEEQNRISLSLFEQILGERRNEQTGFEPLTAV